MQLVVAEHAAVAGMDADASGMVHEQREARCRREVEVPDDPVPRPLDDVDLRQPPEAEPRPQRDRPGRDRRPIDPDVGPGRERLRGGRLVPEGRDPLGVGPVRVVVGRRIEERRATESHDRQLVRGRRAHVEPGGGAGRDPDAVDVPPHTRHPQASRAGLRSVRRRRARVPGRDAQPGSSEIALGRLAELGRPGLDVGLLGFQADAPRRAEVLVADADPRSSSSARGCHRSAAGCPAGSPGHSRHGARSRRGNLARPASAWPGGSPSSCRRASPSRSGAWCRGPTTLPSPRRSWGR